MGVAQVEVGHGPPVELGQGLGPPGEGVMGLLEEASGLGVDPVERGGDLEEDLVFGRDPDLDGGALEIDPQSFGLHASPCGGIGPDGPPQGYRSSTASPAAPEPVA